MSNKFIILLNGPKHSGKDTIGRAIEVIRDGVELFKFAEPSRVFIKTTLDISDAELEIRKDEFIPLFGMTIREAMIAYSEDFCKPKFGKDYFGLLTLEKIERSEARVAVITDSGFEEEAQVLVDHFSTFNVLHVRLHRDGCDFAGDSRSHFTLPGVPHRDVYNNESVHRAAWRVLVLGGLSGAELPL